MFVRRADVAGRRHRAWSCDHRVGSRPAVAPYRVAHARKISCGSGTRTGQQSAQSRCQAPIVVSNRRSGAGGTAPYISRCICVAPRSQSARSPRSCTLHGGRDYRYAAPVNPPRSPRTSFAPSASPESAGRSASYRLQMQPHCGAFTPKCTGNSRSLTA